MALTALLAAFAFLPAVGVGEFPDVPENRWAYKELADSPLVQLSVKQHAPIDVPKNHWANPAVDRMFREGLLKGYPADTTPYKLDSAMKQDLALAETWLKRWEKEKLFEWSCKGFGGYREPSSYELAIATQVTLLNVEAVLRGKKSDVPAAVAARELKTIAMGTSMFRAELTKLGGDPKRMISTLNDLHSLASPNPVALDKSLKLSDKDAIALKNRWRLLGLLVGYPEMHVTDSRYGLAVAYHAMWANITSKDFPPQALEDALAEFPDLARAISGMNTELSKLGADTQAMIDRMNEVLVKRNRLFLGDRR